MYLALVGRSGEERAILYHVKKLMAGFGTNLGHCSHGARSGYNVISNS